MARNCCQLRVIGACVVGANRKRPARAAASPSFRVLQRQRCSEHRMKKSSFTSGTTEECSLLVGGTEEEQSGKPRRRSIDNGVQVMRGERFCVQSDAFASHSSMLEQKCAQSSPKQRTRSRVGRGLRLHSKLLRVLCTAPRGGTRNARSVLAPFSTTVLAHS